MADHHNKMEGMKMTNEKWADLIREHYDEIRDEITKWQWDGCGCAQHDVLIYEDGTVSTVANIGGNDTHTNAYAVWTTRGMEYATPYEFWDESDWIGAVREVVGNDGMSAFWDRIAKDQNAENVSDYMENAGYGYETVSHILTHNAAFDNIMNEIAKNWKQDTESDRIQDADTIINIVLHELEGVEN